MSTHLTPVHPEKFLDMKPMIGKLRRQFDAIDDPFTRKRPTHLLTDCLTSGLAMYQFRDGSMLKFDEASRLDAREQHADVYQLLGDVPSDSTLRRRLDKVDPQALRAAFSVLWQVAEGAAMLRPFMALGGFTPIAIDASGHIESNKVYCDHCLRQVKSDDVHYSHKVVLAAAVSVEARHALPLAFEPIVNGDDDRRQGSESKAALRLDADGIGLLSLSGITCMALN